MKKRSLVISLLVVGAGFGIACGDDSTSKGMPDTGTPLPMVDAGKDAGTPPPDAGGTGGTVAVAEPVPCGSMTCAQPTSLIPAGMAPAGLPIMIPTAMACCFDAASGECGITTALPACMKLAVPDPTCPSIDLGALGGLIGGAGGMMGGGCCTADGQCGVDGAAFGNGCTENGAAAAMLSAIPLIGGLIMIPPAQPCGGGADGGTDAGN